MAAPCEAFGEPGEASCEQEREGNEEPCERGLDGRLEVFGEVSGSVDPAEPSVRGSWTMSGPSWTAQFSACSAATDGSGSRKARQRLRDQILHQRMAYPNGFCDLEPGPQITAHVALARGAVLGRSSRGAAASRRRSRGQRANLATIGLRVDDGSVENFSLSSKQCDPDRQIGQRLEVSRRIPDRDPLQRRLRPRRGR